MFLIIKKGRSLQMNCWKSINMKKSYSERHLMAFSFMISLFSFIILFVPLSFIFGIQAMNDEYFFIFIMISFLIYPVHKALHIVSLLLMKSKFSIYRNKFIPLLFRLYIKITQPILKKKYIFSLIMPFFILNSIFIVSIINYPELYHYFTFLLSLHLGICVADFIYLKWLLNSPSKCFIEENEDGYEILVESKVYNKM